MSVYRWGWKVAPEVSNSEYAELQYKFRLLRAEYISSVFQDVIIVQHEIILEIIKQDLFGYNQSILKLVTHKLLF